MRRVLVMMATLVLLVTGCGGAEPTATSIAPTPTADEPVRAAPAPTRTADAPGSLAGFTGADGEFDVAAFCEGLDVVTDFYLQVEELAGASAEEQELALEALQENVSVVADEIGSDFPDISQALTVFAENAQAPDGEAPYDLAAVDESGAVLIEYYNGTCVESGSGTAQPAGGAECPAPEVLEANGMGCDELGNLFPLGGECPAPEVLEAEGLACDGFGNLFPLDEEPMDTVAECPAPEVLEAEGLACDEFGNLYPIAQGEDVEGDPFYGEDEGYVEEEPYPEDEVYEEEAYEDEVYEDEVYEDEVYEEPVEEGDG